MARTSICLHLSLEVRDVGVKKHIHRHSPESDMNNPCSLGLYECCVAARAQGNTCLQNLLTFLQTDKKSQYSYRIVCLEFSTTKETPDYRDLDLNDLTSLLTDTRGAAGSTSGRILIVQDLSSQVIESLGYLLQIDPLFFASHIDSYQDDVMTMRPSASILPSTARSQSFLNLPYHRILELDIGDLPNKDGLFRDMNVPRKVAILPRFKGVDVGIARHCCSILRTQSKDGLWLGE